VGIVLAFVIAAGMSFASYWKSDEVALRLSKAHPADPVAYARVHNLIEGLCIATGTPKPRLYIVDDPAPNAFATGRNPEHAAIAVTTGLLERMNRVELEAVLAHELSHVRNYDILVSTLAVTMVGFAALLSQFGVRFLWFGGARRRGGDGNGGAGGLIALLALVFLIIAPIAAKAMQLAVSRRRESLADMSAVEITRYPPGLISALEKLKADQAVVSTANVATAHLWIEEPVAHMDDNPRRSRFSHLFDSHPPLDERIAALREL
jgi:heat shock protein HtpX